MRLHPLVGGWRSPRGGCTVELVDGTTSNPKTHIYRTWSIRADSIRKLDRAERVSADEFTPEGDTAE